MFLKIVTVTITEKNYLPATSNSSGISLANFSMAMSLRGPRMTIGRLKLAKQRTDQNVTRLATFCPLSMTPTAGDWPGKVVFICPWISLDWPLYLLSVRPFRRLEICPEWSAAGGHLGFAGRFSWPREAPSSSRTLPSDLTVSPPPILSGPALC